MPILSGTDKLGDFKLRNGNCEHCGKNSTRVDYLSFQLPANIDSKSRTLISNIHNGEFRQTALPKLGITCGCYSRFHRQIAHIDSRRETKVSPDKG